MRKILTVLLAGLTACVTAGCSAFDFASSADDDDNLLLDSYYSTSSSAEEAVTINWAVKPTVSADNIIVPDVGQVDPENETNTAYRNYAIIYQNGSYGFIDYSGNIVVSAKYTGYYNCSCGEMVLYNETEDGEYEYCSLDSDGQVVYTVSQHEFTEPKYYWNESDSTVYQYNDGWDYAVKFTDKKTVVVAKAVISDIGSGYYKVESTDTSAYALAKESSLITGFDYSDYYAPAYKGAGLTAIALQKDGKWGYVSSAGEEIVPFECDSVLSSDNGSLLDSSQKSHPYLFCENFVAVCINSVYGYYSMDGECVIRAGEFEQARPVHGGKAWVRSDGKWGVIQLGEATEEQSSADDSSELQTTAVTTYRRTYAQTTTTTAETTTQQSETEASKPAETTTTKSVTAEATTTTTTQSQTEATTTTSASQVTEEPQTETAETPQTQATQDTAAQTEEPTE